MNQYRAESMISHMSTAAARKGERESVCVCVCVCVCRRERQRELIIDSDTQKVIIRSMSYSRTCFPYRRTSVTLSA